MGHRYNARMRNLEEKIAQVRSEKSEVFAEWHKYHGVTAEDFIDGLKWLDEDPGGGEHEGNVTRVLGVYDGKLWKMKRVYPSSVEFSFLTHDIVDPEYHDVSKIPLHYFGIGGVNGSKTIIPRKFHEGTDFEWTTNCIAGQARLTAISEI